MWLLWMDKIISLLFIIFALSASGHAQNAKITEYEIKAAFLYNFAKFVDWPSEVFADSTQPIIIGIVGRDPFGRVIDQIIKGRKVKGRKLVVKRFNRIKDLEFCHILFISSLEKKRMVEVIEKIKNTSVLTIGETKRFAYEGGIIKLVNQDNKVRFEINVWAAQQANLRISSTLLRLAKIVGHTNNREEN